MLAVGDALNLVLCVVSFAGLGDWPGGGLWVFGLACCYSGFCWSWLCDVIGFRIGLAVYNLVLTLGFCV